MLIIIQERNPPKSKLGNFIYRNILDTWHTYSKFQARIQFVNLNSYAKKETRNSDLFFVNTHNSFPPHTHTHKNLYNIHQRGKLA